MAAAGGRSPQSQRRAHPTVHHHRDGATPLSWPTVSRPKQKSCPGGQGGAMVTYPGDPGPLVSVAARTRAGVITLAGSLFLAIVVLPRLEDLLAGLPDVVGFGAVLLLTTGIRVTAGVMGARAVRPGHRAGQHVDVRLTADDGYQAQRSYSIASAPDGTRIESPSRASTTARSPRT